ncbi:hypothetical protein HK103_001638 [Boothiomyces macroporosus]|uniref:Uncharacterized protein n=1 Tax=Boothiomyces macroporosus TaxID=261099 RepID=A0AAD5UAA9_9FUNG|nr:hypothetical protein HK103_001638 [Boothiomyces macroporosus]
MPPKESKKPENTSFKQQRLKSWQPLLTPKSVIPAFFIIGLIFIPIGAVLYIASDNVHQTVFDYTNCKNAPSTFTTPTENNGITKWKYNPDTKECTIQFQVEKSINAPVYLYYRLTNFYQNNRKYVKSFDLNQLKGDAVPSGSINSLCSPVDVPKTGVTVSINGVSVAPDADAVYYPCGLIANSLFSGVCSINDPTSTVLYNISSKGIAWPSDADKYGKSSYLTNPAFANNITTKVIPPPFWRDAFPQWKNGYTASNFPDLNTWEHFQVWMRTAGLPTFRKLYGVNSQNQLNYGLWQLVIVQNFDCDKFGGTKSIVLSSTSILGGKNYFLGSAYVVIGALCVALGIAFLIRNLKTW